MLLEFVGLIVNRSVRHSVVSLLFSFVVRTTAEIGTRASWQNDKRGERENQLDSTSEHMRTLTIAHAHMHCAVSNDKL